MSTENEGASVPSAAEPRPESPTSPPADAPAPAGTPAPVDAPALASAPAPAEERTAQLPPVALEKEAPAPAAPSAPAVDPAAGSEYGRQTPPTTPPSAPAPEAPTTQFPAGPPQPAYNATNATGVPMPGTPDAGQWYGGAAAPPPYGAAAAPWGAPTPPPRRGRSGGLVAAVLAAALVAGGVGGGIGFWAAKGSDDSSTTVSSSGDPKIESRTPGSVADIASKALPSVVTIEAQSSNGEGGTGTGFVYDTQGHILTNNHVVASAADSGKLSVTFSDGKNYDAEVLGRAQGYDVAVIKLKNPSGAKLTPLPLGDSDKAAVGDATVAIGAPFGLSGTVTTGIVSAKKRPVASSDGGSGGQASYMSALQTDASINPGNSGGPLLNAQGAVIGINSAIQSAGNGGGGFGGGQGQSGSIGLGFAIPINQAKNVAQQLMKDHTPIYPVISATVNMKDNVNGARIASGGDGSSQSVTPGGPADKAGLKPGDVITKLDDTTIDSGPTLISEIWTHKPGDKVTVTYVRDGKTATTEITLGERRGDKVG
ncbi:trypsin-like peptidase domain-containing protein [Streptomyces abikoensis]|uniref:S1C family serine protease n=1 Tax=Streptomyces abikoensis TaxID=97398 RepID=UPI0033E4B9BB